MSPRALSRFATTAALLSPLLGRPAWCGEPTPDAVLSAARDLFIAAEQDEDAGRWSEALDKLQRVAQVKLTPGIRYHTALCEEHLGRLVAALNDYKAAAEQARVEKASDVLRLVDRHVLDSAERVPRITIVIVPTLPDATVHLDGRPVATGEAVLADPGIHSIDADAPGRKASLTTVTVREHDATRVEITLDPNAPPPGPASTSASGGDEMHEAAALPRDPPADSRGRAIALVAGTSALVLGAGGLAAYLAAGREHDGSVQSCAQVVSRQTGACEAQKTAVRVWDWVGVGAWAGAAAAGAVAVVSLVRRHRDVGRGHAAPTPSFSAGVVVGPGSMGVEGAF